MTESGIEGASDDYTYGTLQDLFEDGLDQMARFIYIDSLSSDLYSNVAAYAGHKQLTLLCDVDDLELLRSLTKEHVVVVTKKHLMRGYDYRCKTGIAILLARKMDSQKALLQALGRVGRYGSKYVRLVDEAFKNTGGPVDIAAMAITLNAIKDIRIRAANPNTSALTDFFRLE